MRQNSLYVSVLYALPTIMLFLVANILSSNIFAIIGAAWLVVPLLICKEDIVLLISVLLIPSITMIRLVGVNQTILGIFILLFSLKILLSFDSPKDLVIVIIIHLVSVCVTVFLYMLPNLAVKSFKSMLIVLAMAALFIKWSEEGIDKRQEIIKAFALGTAISIICTILYCFANSLDFIGTYLQGIQSDRNYYSSIMPLACSCAICSIANEVNKKRIYFYIVVAIIIAIGTVLTKSRTAFLMLIISLLASVTFLIVNGTSKSINRFVGILLLGIIGFGGYFIDILGNVITRFSDSSVASASGRTIAWGFYLNKMSESLISFLFGKGSSSAYVSNNVMSFVEHNTLVESLFTTGLLGTITLIIVLFVFSNKIENRSIFIRFVYYIPFWATIICFLMINQLYNEQLVYSIIVGIALASFCQNLNLEKKQYRSSYLGQ